MIDQQTADRILQTKLDALSAKHLHVKRLTWLHKWNKLVDVLAIAVPTVYFAFRFIAKGTGAGPYVEILWEILAALLLVLTILKVGFSWQEHAQTHSKLLGENISLAGQANNLLAERQTVSPEGARLFFVLAQTIESADRELLGQVPEEDKQWAYREGLKELKVDCTRCKSSPWEFIKGSCQQCGNTPKSQRRLEGTV
jgi:mobilome CxxCx(11)CxxC protein